MVNFCETQFQRLRDIPCDCAPPPFQCEVDEFAELPMSAPCPPNPTHVGSTEPLANGDIYVVINDPSGQPTPYMFWDCNWYPLAIDPGDQDTDWFKVGTVGPGYGGINTDDAYHNGNIAINRTSIRGTSGVFDMTGQILADGIFNGTPDPPVLGLGGSGGTRLMWLPEAAAFRAGNVNSNQWDGINIGNYSAAFNFNSEASGDFSFAANDNNTASGRFSAAFGSTNIASGDSAFVTGQGCTGSGDDSFTAGEFNSAVGRNAVVFGSSSSATGDQGFTHGINAVNDAFMGVVFGDDVQLTAAGDKTVLFGVEEVSPPAIYTQDRSFIVHNLRPFHHSPPTAPTDSDIANSHMSWYLDEGANNLIFRVRYSGGTLKTGTVALV